MREPIDDPVIRRLARWSERQAAVRAMILFNSRANPGAALQRTTDLYR